MADVIRMAAHANHYLAVLDFQERPLWLGRAKRCATPDQRLMLHAVDRGYSHPGCDIPGYLCEVHHVTDWAAGGRTDIDQLTFACAPHHKLLETGWTTRKHPNGTTQWLPPAHLDHGQPRTNTLFHPQRHKQPPEDDDAA
jgi:hypothetical protein